MYFMEQFYEIFMYFMEQFYEIFFMFANLEPT
jgi:hypothetical protein